jgi:hypothetical protein
VLVGAEVVTKRGFRTAEAKDAFDANQIEWAVEVPDAVRAKLRRDGSSRPRQAAGHALMITHAGTGEHEFVTDRGPATLAAWWIQGPQTIGPIWVLDPLIEHWHPSQDAAGAPPLAPTQGQPLLWPVELRADGRSLVIPWLGSHPQVETVPAAKLIETPAAVSAVAVRQDMDFEGWVTAVGIRHNVKARLDKPLGHRVFVDLHGNALQVLATIKPQRDGTTQKP